MKLNDTGNLIVNGNFDSNSLDGWDVTGSDTLGYPVAYNGAASLPNGSSLSQTVSVTGGETYFLSYKMSILYQGSGHITVVAHPSGMQLFQATTTGNQSGISLTVTEQTDTSIMVNFSCGGGELDVDNVSLELTTKAFVVGGDFSDTNMPGWVKTGNSSGTMPSVVDGHLSLPAGTSVYQDIVPEQAGQIQLAYSLSFPDGATGTFSVTSRPSYSSYTSTTLYTDSTGLASQPVFFYPPEGDTIIRLTFSCTSGEVNVDDVVMDYAPSTVISEELTGNHAPWIPPGTNGVVTFSVQANTTVSSGDRIHFTAPAGTTLVDASIPGLGTSYYTFSLSDDHLTGNLTLTKSITDWGSCELTLSVDSGVAAGASLSDGIARYFMADGRQMGDDAGISVIAATVTITEQQTDGHTPWIFPGTSGTVPFSVVTDSPDGTGSCLYFTAPTYTDPENSVASHNAIITGVTFSDPNLAGKYTFTSENDGQNARVTLTADNITWSGGSLTLAVDNEMPSFGTLDNGKIQYLRSDGQQVGTTASVTVIAASNNPWDNVSGVHANYIGMQSDDTSTSSNKGTLFVNRENDENGTPSGHSIPVFVGITFTRFSEDFPAPSASEVQSALSLVGLASDNETIVDISANLALTGNTDYRKEYYKPTASSPAPELSPASGAYDVELNLGAWCPVVYDYTGTTIPGDIDVYIHLEAPLSVGTYTHTSNGNLLSKLTVNFIPRKKYQYSDTAGSSNYILITSEDSGDKITYIDDKFVRNVGATHQKKIFRIFIDTTKESSKYTFSFVKQMFQYYNLLYDPNTDFIHDNEGYINSIYLKGMSIDGKPQWTNYGQHLPLPGGFGDTSGAASLTSDVYNASSYIGMTGTHEKSGWALSGEIKAANGGFTIRAGEIAFFGLSIDYESSSEGVEYTDNIKPGANGNSRIHLIDNFGNHVYMTPKCTAAVSSVNMTVEVNEK